MQALAIELEILGDMTSPHGGFGAYQNLLKFSEKLDDASWVVANTVTRTADDSATASAPDGSATADKLNFGGAATVDSLQQDSGVVSTTAAYTFSVWLRSVSGGTTIVIKIEDADENNTTVISSLSSTRWERYSVSKTFATAGGNIKVTILENAAADAPVVMAWGAQLEKSSKANVYARTIDEAISSAAPSVGLAIGKDVHITGNLEVDGTTTLHVSTAEQNIKGSLKVDGNTTLGDAATDTVTINAGPIKLINATQASDALEFGSGANLANLYTSANDTLKTDDALLVAGTLGVTGATTLSSTLGVTGATTLSSTLATTGNATFDGDVTLGNANLDTVTINAGPVNLPNATAAADALVLGADANLYRSAADTLKTDDALLVAGTLGVTGATTLSSTLAVTGNVTVNTDKFSVTAASGNTVVGGTLTAGATSVSGDLSVRANDKVVMDSTDAGGTASDTYMVHDNANDRIRLYVDGVEVARFKK